MAEAKFLLKRPITELYFDLNENSLEVEGYEKVIHCEHCGHRIEHYDSNGVFSLRCKFWDGYELDLKDYCSHGITEEKNETN